MQHCISIVVEASILPKLHRRKSGPKNTRSSTGSTINHQVRRRKGRKKSTKKEHNQVDDDLGASVQAAGAATPTAGVAEVVEVVLTTFSR
jgi:hypothetical protein